MDSIDTSWPEKDETSAFDWSDEEDTGMSVAAHANVFPRRSKVVLLPRKCWDQTLLAVMSLRHAAHVSPLARPLLSPVSVIPCTLYEQQPTFSRYFLLSVIWPLMNVTHALFFSLFPTTTEWGGARALGV